MPNRRESAPRVLFLGMQNQMSYQALQALIDHDVNIVGIVVAAVGIESRGLPDTKPSAIPSFSNITLPVVNQFVIESVYQIAADHEIPLFPAQGNTIAEIQKAISVVKPDIAAIACFPNRLPAKVLSEVEHGFINLHPSILPFHRGPSPLFWIFRSPTQEASGVTIHRVDEKLDSGDVIIQERLMFETGITGVEAAKMCGKLGGKLMAMALNGLWTGAIVPYPQPLGGSYDPFPKPSDFWIDSSWSAKRAFNFMRGTEHWKQSYWFETEAERIELIEALAFGTEPQILGNPFLVEKVEYIQFKSGVLTARRK